MEVDHDCLVYARQLLEDEKWDMAIAFAKKNLESDPPLNLKIQNYVVLACAEGDTKDKEDWRQAAEVLHLEASSSHSVEELEFIELRRLLDFVARNLAKDAESSSSSNIEVIELSDSDGNPELADDDHKPKPPHITPANILTDGAAPISRTTTSSLVAAGRGAAPSRQKLTLRRPQQTDAWWSVSQEKFDSAKTSSQHHWSRAGNIMEVESVARVGGICTRCDENGTVECLADPKIPERCAYCIFRARKCRSMGEATP
ncbi:hypothetical protein M409DRAFT_20075 [Zasmidium cellare ATCC 36951]|uniref:Uncharacterized protein n=1 Tax=Zasmidium cellare ATCC 36951 TaxID=1080233 RepID=A0A6A6CU22_ZASCE|nr:uncharacterized protein M409DRAFT_20075 [Zasmidium cellare ATCC 36951]KAF2169660.1 hypothetical protein M409DRAFT_20075 [Zasmidium cellare ATCC 36951]